MTKLFNVRLTALAAATITVAGLGLFSSSSQASVVDDLTHCSGSSRANVIRCCDQVYRANPPKQLALAHPNCRAMTRCSLKAGANYCRVVLVTSPNTNPNPPPGKGRGKP
jgi:hypothetical protein